MHGGSISAYDRTDGQRGACLDVSIPLGNAHLKPEEIMTDVMDKTDTKALKKLQARKNFNVLIVDDDPEIAGYITSELGEWYHFDSARNGKDALKKLLVGNFDLVISDIVMPEMDGIELLKSIKTNTNISDIPVILLTSKSEVSDRLEGFKKGADAFLAKPFSMEELHILIDNLVSNVRRLRGKFSGVQDQTGKVEKVEVMGNNDLLMDRIMKCVNQNLSNPDFNVEKLTVDVGISRAQLHRKMKEITGISTGEFIRNLRMEQAARLIVKGDVNITQVAYAVGFNNQTHFSTVFKKHFGVTPKEYYVNHHENI
jgi:YesN/AraC family two-component response regulator